MAGASGNWGACTPVLLPGASCCWLQDGRVGGGSAGAMLTCPGAGEEPARPRCKPLASAGAPLRAPKKQQPNRLATESARLPLPCRRVVAGASGAPPALGGARPRGHWHQARLRLLLGPVLSGCACCTGWWLHAQRTHAPMPLSRMLGRPQSSQCSHKPPHVSLCLPPPGHRRVARLLNSALFTFQACSLAPCMHKTTPRQQDVARWLRRFQLTMQMATQLIAPPRNSLTPRPSPAHPSPPPRCAWQGGFDRQLREALGPLFPASLLPSLASGARAAIQVRGEALGARPPALCFPAFWPQPHTTAPLCMGLLDASQHLFLVPMNRGKWLFLLPCHTAGPAGCLPPRGPGGQRRAGRLLGPRPGHGAPQRRAPAPGHPCHAPLQVSGAGCPCSAPCCAALEGVRVSCSQPGLAQVVQWCVCWLPACIAAVTLLGETRRVLPCKQGLRPSPACPTPPHPLALLPGQEPHLGPSQLVPPFGCCAAAARSRAAGSACAAARRAARAGAGRLGTQRGRDGHW